MIKQDLFFNKSKLKELFLGFEFQYLQIFRNRINKNIVQRLKLTINNSNNPKERTFE